MVRFNLNGKNIVYNGNDTDRLLDVLRNEYGLNGPKEGCGEGECGACSVLINGQLSNSCLIAVGSLENAEIVTIEGFSKTKQFKVLEDTFARAGAVQCGFCTPGMIMAAQSLLLKNNSPTEDDIRAAISGNLCRCTGYNMIIDAVFLAAKEGKGLW